jgi:hypothetical protein
MGRYAIPIATGLDQDGSSQSVIDTDQGDTSDTERSDGSSSWRQVSSDGPSGMGNDDQGRALQATRRTRGVNEITSGIRRDVTVGKGELHVNAEPFDPAIRTTHLGHSTVEYVELTGT